MLTRILLLSMAMFVNIITQYHNAGPPGKGMRLHLHALRFLLHAYFIINLFLYQFT